MATYNFYEAQLQTAPVFLEVFVASEGIACVEFRRVRS